ncbi:hypothetical protein HMPREF0045_01267 [Actinomyces graevenitzii C83]|uniref:Phosphoglyceromutase n=1 Tax=Actinomyces graevenitzii C83 TaxID=435830 RepID=G9PG11_9ACTO|nr:hypothetical protein [Actinomyces graevenitzii]EHM88156.1 hypothetical protein HMPREF0045_01267 [Actinomyces graevenitzii C83]
MGAWLAHMLAKLFAGLLACLLLASGANAATLEGAAVSAQSKAAGSAVTRNCGATATSRVKPLVMVVTYGLTWRDLNGVLDGKNIGKNGDGAEIRKYAQYIAGYPATPMNLLIPKSANSLSKNGQLAMLYSGRGGNFTTADYDLTTSPLGKTLRDSECSFAEYRVGGSYETERPFGQNLSDVTVVDAASAPLTEIASYLSRIRVYYGDNVDIMLLSLANGTYYSDGQAAKLYLALVPSLKDVNAKTGLVQAPSVRRDNLIQLTDIAPTIAARYGAKPPLGATGKALPQVPGRVDNSSAIEKCVDFWEAQQRSFTEGTVSSARTNLIHFLMEQSTHSQASQKVMGFNMLCVVLAMLVIVLVWRNKFPKLDFYTNTPDASRSYLLLMRWLAVFTACLPLGYLLLNATSWYVFGVEPNDYRLIVAGTIPEDNQAIVGLTKLHLVTFMGAVAIAVVFTCLLELITIKFANYSVSFIIACALNGLFWLGDGIIGGNLAFNSPLAVSALTTQRLYGLSDAGFALGAVGFVLALVTLTSWLKPRRGLRTSLIVAGTIGALAVLTIGLPSLGDNSAGALALTGALVVAMLKLSERNLRLRGLVISGLIGASLLSVIAVIEWCCFGQNSSYLGSLGQKFLDGTFIDVMAARIAALLSPIFSADDEAGTKLIFALVTITVVILAWIKVYRATRRADVPARYVVTFNALTTLVLLELVLNDAGFAMMRYSLCLLVPLALVMSVELKLFRATAVETKPETLAASK